MSAAPSCARIALLIQADHDGELDAADAAEVAAHLAECPACTALQGKLSAVSAAMRNDGLRHPASPKLRRAVQAMAPRGFFKSGWAGPAAATALAACLLIAILPRAPGGGVTSAIVLDGHLRALQPGHLLDVVSTDRHTVKPWFDGRLDYAPPVRDFAAAGFPLKGGRLDYLGQRPVAALVYGRDRHLIDVYVYPGGQPEGQSVLRGYNTVAWSQGGMAFWAVSDLNAADLARFRRLWAVTD